MNDCIILFFLTTFVLAIRTQRDPMTRRHLISVFFPISYLALIVLGGLHSLLTDNSIHVRDTGFILSLFVIILIMIGISSIKKLRKEEKSYGKIIG